MRRNFYFSAIVCVLLSVFVFSADAVYSQLEKNAYKIQDDYKTLAQNRALKVIEARSLMDDIAGKYNENLKDIQKGKRILLSTVFTGAAAAAVTYVSGGSTVTVMVPRAIKAAVESLNLAGSINENTELESAYESAILELQSRIGLTQSAIYHYSFAWPDYSRIVREHNSQYHGSGSSPSDPPHGISKYQPPEFDDSLPSFSCPDGSCGLTWRFPSSARTAHYAKCGTKDDPYNKSLKGCYEVFYTCNTTERARHQPNDCGLEKWVRKMGVWSKTACTSDYRNCTQNMQRHATVLGTNQISMCGPAESSSPVASPTPTPTPTDGTPNCPDCTTHCSSPCSCTNSGTCNGTVSYHACGQHETSVSGDHSNGTYTCGIHSGYKCQESHDHKTYISSCTSTDSNGNSCTNTGGYYECQPHSHTYPSPPPSVTCSRPGCDASEDHRVPPCSACGAGYWTCGDYASWSENQHRVRTCRRSGCGNTWQRCVSSTPDCNVASGQRCWAADP